MEIWIIIAWRNLIFGSGEYVMADFYTLSIYVDHKNEMFIAPVLDLIVPGSYVFECTIENNDRYNSRFCIYFDSKEKADLIKENLVSIILKQLDKSEIEAVVEGGEDKDWQNEWKKFFKPIHFGNRLSVLPAWEEINQKSNDIVVYLDPGMAFGSGAHATTKGCLVFLEKLVEKGMDVLDFGTGSGILAIAAKKLGAAQVDALDNDPIAVDVSKKNAVQNNCKDINFFCGEGKDIPQKEYDLIVANITADVIMENFDYILKGQNKLKYLILSGIIDHRKPELDEFLNKKNIAPKEIWFEEKWYSYLLEF